MSDTPTFSSIASQVWVEDDYEATARAVASTIKLSPFQVGLLLETMKGAIYDIDRQRRARVIDGLFDDFGDPPMDRLKAHRKGGVVSERQAKAEALMQETFLLAGTVVRWADATAAQHYAKIEELEMMIGGLRSTITAHERAIEAIHKAKAKTLGGVPKHVAVNILTGVLAAA